MLFLPSYYLFSWNKEPNSGQAAQLAARRERDLSTMDRDPRDTTVKTLEQKKQRDGTA
jgi:hypothetical protein